MFPRDAQSAIDPELTTGKSVVFLFMQGGPPQHDTFEPKPDAPVEIAGPDDPIPTNVPGIHLGAPMQRLAAHADKLTIVRSFVTGTQHGGLKPIVSEDTYGASIGAVYNRIVGTMHPDTGMPRSAALWPKAIDSKQMEPRNKWGRFDDTGKLGQAYAPFLPGGDGPFQQNLKLHIERSRFDDRRYLLNQLDTLRRDVDHNGQLDGVEGMRAQAYDMLIKGVGKAFDIKQEDPATIARYDTSRFHNPALWGKHKNGDRGYYTAHSKTLGKLMLMARRLVEAGVGMITVNTEFVWDFHSDANNVDIHHGNRLVAAPFDHAVSTFIEDIEARGLCDKVLLVCCGEMGRSPKINKKGGRDHWPSLAPLMLYGAGAPGGKLVGRSTRDGGKPDSTPLTPTNLLSTISNTLLHLDQVRLIPGLPTQLNQFVNRMAETRGVC